MAKKPKPDAPTKKRGRPPLQKQREFVRLPFTRGGALSADAEIKTDEADFTEITDIKKRLYLQQVARMPGLTQAAYRAGISPKTAYLWRQGGDPQFEAAFAVARRLGLQRAENELWRRGVEGYDKPVYHQGQLVGTERVFSDTAAIFMLKGAMPETYRERFEHVGAGGGPIEVRNSYADLSTEELLRRADAAREVLRDVLQNQPSGPRSGDLVEGQVIPQETPEAAYEALVALRKAGKAGGNGNGSNGGGR